MILLTIIFLLGTGINGNMPSTNNWFYPRGETGIFLLLNTNESDPSLKISSPYLTFYGILFIFILMTLFAILVISFYYRSLLLNYIFKIWSKMKTNNDNINEHVTVLHQTPTLNKSSSNYLTVPQTNYYYH
jgi:predicted membrane protein